MNKAVVLTGDLVGSSDAGRVAVDEAMALIKEVAEKQAKIIGVPTRFTRFRGDGWQIYCARPEEGYRLALLILAGLQSRSTLPASRIAIGIGSIEYLPPDGLASASGEAFELSGRVIDHMTSSTRMYLSTQSPEGRWLRPLFAYLDWQSGRWSPEQAEAVAIAFETNPPQPNRVAHVLGISRQAAQARLRGAGYAPLITVIDALKIEQRD